MWRDQLRAFRLAPPAWRDDEEVLAPADRVPPVGEVRFRGRWRLEPAVQNQVELQIMKSKQPHLVGRCFRAINLGASQRLAVAATSGWPSMTVIRMLEYRRCSRAKARHNGFLRTTTSRICWTVSGFNFKSDPTSHRNRRSLTSSLPSARSRSTRTANAEERRRAGDLSRTFEDRRDPFEAAPLRIEPTNLAAREGPRQHPHKTRRARRPVACGDCVTAHGGMKPPREPPRPAADDQPSKSPAFSTAGEI